MISKTLDRLWQRIDQLQSLLPLLCDVPARGTDGLFYAKDAMLHDGMGIEWDVLEE